MLHFAFPVYQVIIIIVTLVSILAPLNILKIIQLKPVFLVSVLVEHVLAYQTASLAAKDFGMGASVPILVLMVNTVMLLIISV
jgi:hypothetical protein